MMYGRSSRSLGVTDIAELMADSVVHHDQELLVLYKIH